MRRKFVPLSYVKKKKLREEMKELVEKGRNFIYGEKNILEEKNSLKKNFKLL